VRCWRVRYVRWRCWVTRSCRRVYRIVVRRCGAGGEPRDFGRVGLGRAVTRGSWVRRFAVGVPWGGGETEIHFREILKPGVKKFVGTVLENQLWYICMRRALRYICMYGMLFVWLLLVQVLWPVRRARIHADRRSPK